jgi:hypothetical protein
VRFFVNHSSTAGKRVQPGSVAQGEVNGQGAVVFSVAYNGKEVDVVHVGSPPELSVAKDAPSLESPADVWGGIAGKLEMSFALRQPRKESLDEFRDPAVTIRLARPIVGD